MEIGLFMALHTYGRQLNQHPHIHLSVTRGGLCLKHGIWRPFYLKRNARQNINYISLYLKRPPMAASELRHYTGGAVVHHYYDHRTRQHRRQILSQEDMLLRYISHIPSRHF